jgi:hypothetical protein
MAGLRQVGEGNVRYVLPHHGSSFPHPHAQMQMRMQMQIQMQAQAGDANAAAAIRLGRAKEEHAWWL